MLATRSKIAGSVTSTASPLRVRSIADELDRDRARRVRRQVACLASAGPAAEIEVAVMPHRADPGGVRAPARPDRAEEESNEGTVRAEREETVPVSP